MKLILVRHGQTHWNHAQRFQGWSDIPLDDVGRQQANALAERLADQVFDFAYSSPMTRALETANLITRQRICIQTDVRLQEINFGGWEGMTYAEIQENDPEALQTWENDVVHHAPPGGETVEQLARRVQSALQDFHARHQGQTVLVVAHGGVLQSLICLALDMSPAMYWQFQLSTASLSELSFYPTGAILNFLNDTSHLRTIHDR